jgi:Golgi phosphoprotein 3 (GPP34)
MEPPASLADQLFLLAYDPRRQRIAGGSNHGILIRAAALEELRQAGHLGDEFGKVRATGRHVDDAVLAGLLREITESTKPRPWKHWVARGEKGTYRAVRERLEERLIILVETRRVLLIFPVIRATLREPGIVDELRTRFQRILTGVGAASAHDAALIGLAAAGELGTVLPRPLRRQYRDRIKALSQGPVPPALRRIMQERKAAAASAATSG